MTYEVVKTLIAQSTARTKREAFLVKTAPVICRKRATMELYEVDHVIVEALSTVDDGVMYEETHVVASDELGTAHDAVLYLATRALTVEEAMFSIGKVIEKPIQGPVDSPEKDNPEQEDTNGN